MGIQKRQNETKMQQLVVVQNQTYKHAKRINTLLFFVSVIIPVIINFVLFIELSDKLMAILSMLSFLIMFLTGFLSKSIKINKQKAAMVQLQFDAYVFDIEDKIKIDKDVVYEQVEKYKNKDWKRKTNWYSDYDKLGKTKAIFYAQKQNVAWSKKLSDKYWRTLFGLFVLLLLIGVFNLIVFDFSVIKALSIAFTLIPTIDYVKEFLRMKNDDESKIEEINKMIISIEKSFEKLDDNELLSLLIILQHQIHDFRKNKYMIPDWFDKIHFRKLQAVEDRKAEDKTKIKDNKK